MKFEPGGQPSGGHHQRAADQCGDIMPGLAVGSKSAPSNSWSWRHCILALVWHLYIGTATGVIMGKLLNRFSHTR